MESLSSQVFKSRLQNSAENSEEAMISDVLSDLLHYVQQANDFF